MITRNRKRSLPNVPLEAGEMPMRRRSRKATRSTWTDADTIKCHALLDSALTTLSASTQSSDVSALDFAFSLISGCHIAVHMLPFLDEMWEIGQVFVQKEQSDVGLALFLKISPCLLSYKMRHVNETATSGMFRIGLVRDMAPFLKSKHLWEGKFAHIWKHIVGDRRLRNVVHTCGPTLFVSALCIGSKHKLIPLYDCVHKLCAISQSIFAQRPDDDGARMGVSELRRSLYESGSHVRRFAEAMPDPLMQSPLCIGKLQPTKYCVATDFEELDFDATFSVELDNAAHMCTDAQDKPIFIEWTSCDCASCLDTCKERTVHAVPTVSAFAILSTFKHLFHFDYTCLQSQRSAGEDRVVDELVPDGTYVVNVALCSQYLFTKAGSESTFCPFGCHTSGGTVHQRLMQDEIRLTEPRRYQQRASQLIKVLEGLSRDIEAVLEPYRYGIDTALARTQQSARTVRALSACLKYIKWIVDCIHEIARNAQFVKSYNMIHIIVNMDEADKHVRVVSTAYAHAKTKQKDRDIMRRGYVAALRSQARSVCDTCPCCRCDTCCCEEAMVRKQLYTVTTNTEKSSSCLSLAALALSSDASSGVHALMYKLPALDISTVLCDARMPGGGRLRVHHNHGAASLSRVASSAPAAAVANSQFANWIDSCPTFVSSWARARHILLTGMLQTEEDVYWFLKCALNTRFMSAVLQAAFVQCDAETNAVDGEVVASCEAVYMGDEVDRALIDRNVAVKLLEENLSSESGRERMLQSMVRAWFICKNGTEQKCPGCRTPVDRDSGCMHVCCSVCATHYCYMCNRVYPLRSNPDAKELHDVLAKSDRAHIYRSFALGPYQTRCVELATVVTSNKTGMPDFESAQRSHPEYWTDPHLNHSDRFAHNTPPFYFSNCPQFITDVGSDDMHCQYGWFQTKDDGDEYVCAQSFHTIGRLRNTLVADAKPNAADTARMTEEVTEENVDVERQEQAEGQRQEQRHAEVAQAQDHDEDEVEISQCERGMELMYRLCMALHRFYSIVPLAYEHERHSNSLFLLAAFASCLQSIELSKTDGGSTAGVAHPWLSGLKRHHIHGWHAATALNAIWRNRLRTMCTLLIMSGSPEGMIKFVAKYGEECFETEYAYLAYTYCGIAKPTMVPKMLKRIHRPAYEQLPPEERYKREIGDTLPK